jgi:PAS domain S-box-containing protein
MLTKFSPSKEGIYESTTGEFVEIDEEFLNETSTAVSRFLRDGKMSNWETFLICKNKKVIPVGINIALLYNKEGNRIGAVGILRDITERKKAGKKIIEARDFLENIFKTSIDGLIISDPKGAITMVNDAAEKMFGYSKNELVGKYTRELAPKGKEYDEKGKEIGEKIREQGFITGVEYPWLRKDGSLVDIELNIALLKDKEGNTTGAVGSVRDITERKRVEEALRKSEAKYRELVQNANSIILRMDLKGYITFFNEFAQSFFGYSEDEIIGRNVVGTIVPEIDSFGRDLTAMIEDIGRNPEQYKTNENENMRRNGERVWVAWTNRAIHDRGGNITEILCVGNDITERRQAEKKLVDYQNQLKSLASQLTLTEERERRRFANYLHDRIGQALFISKIKLGMIKEQVSSSDIAKSLEEILNIVEQMIKDTRSLTFELSPPILYQLGLEAAL